MKITRKNVPPNKLCKTLAHSQKHSCTSVAFRNRFAPFASLAALALLPLWLKRYFSWKTISKNSIPRKEKR